MNIAYLLTYTNVELNYDQGYPSIGVNGFLESVIVGFSPDISSYKKEAETFFKVYYPDLILKDIDDLGYMSRKTYGIVRKKGYAIQKRNNTLQFISHKISEDEEWSRVNVLGYFTLVPTLIKD